MISQTIGLLSQISESALEDPKNKKGCVLYSTDLPGTFAYPKSNSNRADWTPLSSASSAPPIKCNTYKVCRFPSGQMIFKLVSSNGSSFDFHWLQD